MLLLKYFCAFFVIYGLMKMRFLLAFIGGYIYFAGQAEYRMVMMEHQINHFSGYREGQIDVEVSPPPYASNGSKSIGERLRDLFRS